MWTSGEHVTQFLLKTTVTTLFICLNSAGDRVLPVDSTDSTKFRLRFHRFWRVPSTNPPILPTSDCDSTDSTNFQLRFH